MSRVIGYNIALKLGNKTCIGRTQEDLTVTPTMKESITKDDQGNKQVAITGQEVTFKVTGLMEFNGTDTTKLDSDALLEQSLKKGAAAEIAAQYMRTGGDTYGGTVVMTGYTETSNSEDEAQYTADFKVTGAFTKVTQQSNG